MNDEWRPDWALHPGVIVRELLEGFHLSPRVAAAVLRVSVPDVVAVTECRAPITPEFARGLARLPTSEALWLNLQRDYEQALARGSRDVTHGDCISKED